MGNGRESKELQGMMGSGMELQGMAQAPYRALIIPLEARRPAASST